MLVDVCIVINVLTLFLADVHKKPYFSKDFDANLAKL